MEILARVIFSLVVFSFAFSLTHASSKDLDKSDDISKVFIQSRCFRLPQRREIEHPLDTKAWFRRRISAVVN